MNTKDMLNDYVRVFAKAQRDLAARAVELTQDKKRPLTDEEIKSLMATEDDYENRS